MQPLLPTLQQSVQEQVNTNSLIKRNFIQKLFQSPCLAQEGLFDHLRDGSFTLKEWLLHTCTYMMQQDLTTNCRLPFVLWMNRIAAVITKSITCEKVVDLFGDDFVKNPQKDLVTVLVILSKQHDFFDTPIGTLLNGDEDRVYEVTTDILYKNLIVFDELFRKTFDRVTEGINNLQKACKIIGDQQKTKDIQTFIQKGTALDYLYKVRMKSIKSYLEGVDRKDPHRKKIFIEQAISQVIQIKKIFTDTGRVLQDALMNVLISMPLVRKQKFKLEEENASKIARIDIKNPQTSFPGIEATTSESLTLGQNFCEMTTTSLQPSSTEIATKEAPEKSFEGNIMYSMIKDFMRLSESMTNLNSVMSSLPSTITKIDDQNKQWQKQISKQKGGKKYIQQLQVAYKTFLEFEKIFTSCVEDIPAFFDAIQIRLENDREIFIKNINDSYNEDISWLETLNEHVVHKKKKVKQREEYFKEKSSSSEEEQIDVQEMESIPLIEQSLQKYKGDELFSILNLPELQDLKTLTQTTVWMSNYLTTNTEIERVNLSRKEAKTHAFLAACSVEVAFRSLLSNKITSFLPAVQAFLLNSHVTLEQAASAQYIETTGNLPNQHHLVKILQEGGFWDILSEEEQKYIVGIDYALIWFRYPNATMEHFRHRNPPKGLRILMQTNILLKKQFEGILFTEQEKEELQIVIEDLASFAIMLHRVFAKILPIDLEEKETAEGILQAYTNQVQKFVTRSYFTYENEEEQKDVLYEIARGVGGSGHLEDAKKHLRHILAVSHMDTIPTHLNAWKNQQFLHVQWFFEQTYQHYLTRTVGFTQTHNFRKFQEILSNYGTIHQDKVVPDILKRPTLCSFNYGRAVHYPHQTTRLIRKIEHIQKYLVSIRVAKKAMYSTKKGTLYTFDHLLEKQVKPLLGELFSEMA